MVLKRLYGSLSVLIGPYRSLKVFVGPDATLCFLMGPFLIGSISVHISLYVFLWVRMGPNGSFYSLCVLMDSNGSLCVIIGLMRPYGFL